MSRSGRSWRRGFSLLEVMVATAILSGALTWMVVGVTRNIQAENHAKLMTTATFLARGKMSEIEDQLYEKGFSEFEEEQGGGFEEKGFQRFSWKVVVDKVQLPSTDQVQSILTNAQQAKQALTGEPGKDAPASGASGQPQSPLSASAGVLGSQFEIIKQVLEQGIRRITVQVLWREGKRERDVAVVAYFTDVRKVDQAINLSIPSNLPGMGGAAGGSSSGSAKGGSK